MKKVLFTLLFPIVSLGFAQTVVPTGTVSTITPTTVNPNGYIVEDNAFIVFNDFGSPLPFVFNAGAKIKILTGGTINILSGTLTSTTGNWQGIEVDAEEINPNISPNEYPVNLGNTKHGVLIENAVIGINCLPRKTDGSYGYAADINFKTYSYTTSGGGILGVVLKNSLIDVQIVNHMSLADVTGYVPNKTISLLPTYGGSPNLHNFNSEAETGFNLVNTGFSEDPFNYVQSYYSQVGFSIDNSSLKILNSKFREEETAVRIENNSILDFINNHVWSGDFGVVAKNNILIRINDNSINSMRENSVFAGENQFLVVDNNSFQLSGYKHTVYTVGNEDVSLTKNWFFMDDSRRPSGTYVSPDYFTAIQVESNLTTMIRQNEFTNYPHSYIDINNPDNSSTVTMCSNIFHSNSILHPLQTAAIKIDNIPAGQDQGNALDGANNTFDLLGPYFRVINNSNPIQFFNQNTNIANQPINNGMSVGAFHSYASPNELCSVLPRMAQNEVEDVEEVIENTIGFYPNPTQSIVNVENVADGSSIQVYNSVGKLVINETNVNTIDLSAYPNGLYLMRVVTNNEIVSTQKIVKN